MCQTNVEDKSEGSSPSALHHHLSADAKPIWAAAKAVAQEIWHNDPARPFTDEVWERELQRLHTYRDEPDWIIETFYAAKCFRIAAAALKAASSQRQIEEAQRADTASQPAHRQPDTKNPEQEEKTG